MLIVAFVQIRTFNNDNTDENLTNLGERERERKKKRVAVMHPRFYDVYHKHLNGMYFN